MNFIVIIGIVLAFFSCRMNITDHVHNICTNRASGQVIEFSSKDDGFRAWQPINGDAYLSFVDQRSGKRMRLTAADERLWVCELTRLD